LFFSIFKPEKTWPKKFHANFFCDFQLSRQKFSGKKTFTAKKSMGFPVPVPGPYWMVYVGDVS